ncbi:MAG: hypothetical protein M3067_05955, partial [Chloroflexota bacterium]|nr:hypothetical protein [Chloroflexota bacterium]
ASPSSSHHYSRRFEPFSCGPMQAVRVVDQVGDGGLQKVERVRDPLGVAVGALVRELVILLAHLR